MLAPLGPAWGHLRGYVVPSASYVGLSWGYVGPSWGYVGPSWGYVAQLGAMWARLAAHVGPSGGYVGAASAHFGAYVEPCWPIWSHKIEKRGKPLNTVNCVTFVGLAAGRAPPLLSYGEERMLYGSAPCRRTQRKVDLGFLHDILWSFMQFFSQRAVLLPNSLSAYNIAVWTCKKAAPNCTLLSLQNVAFATAKHHAMEGRTRPGVWPAAASA